MYNVQDASSLWAWLYFIAIIILGAMVMMNLVLAVVMAKFREVRGWGSRETVVFVGSLGSFFVLTVVS